jgi:hypothetical protein
MWSLWRRSQREKEDDTPAKIEYAIIQQNKMHKSLSEIIIASGYRLTDRFVTEINSLTLRYSATEHEKSTDMLDFVININNSKPLVEEYGKIRSGLFFMMRIFIRDRSIGSCLMDIDKFKAGHQGCASGFMALIKYDGSIGSPNSRHFTDNYAIRFVDGLLSLSMDELNSMERRANTALHYLKTKGRYKNVVLTNNEAGPRELRVPGVDEAPADQFED